VGRTITGSFQNGQARESEEVFDDWATVRAEIEEEQREARQRREKTHLETEPTTSGTNGMDTEELIEGSDYCEQEGELPPLVDEGQRIMVCTAYKLQPSQRHGPKYTLSWIHEGELFLLNQFFQAYARWPIRSKALRNWVTGMGMRPGRLDRLTLRSLVGLRAEVFIETVKPTFEEGPLKGRTKPPIHFYSKVSEILNPVGRVDKATLTELVLSYETKTHA